MQVASSVLKTAISEQQRDSFCFKACDARCSIKGRTHKVKHNKRVTDLISKHFSPPIVPHL